MLVIAACLCFVFLGVLNACVQYHNKQGSMFTHGMRYVTLLNICRQGGDTAGRTPGHVVAPRMGQAHAQPAGRPEAGRMCAI
jgi:hypothetical protein